MCWALVVEVKMQMKWCHLLNIVTSHPHDYNIIIMWQQLQVIPEHKTVMSPIVQYKGQASPVQASMTKQPCIISNLIFYPNSHFNIPLPIINATNSSFSTFSSEHRHYMPAHHSHNSHKTQTTIDHNPNWVLLVTTLAQTTTSMSLPSHSGLYSNNSKGSHGVGGWVGTPHTYRWPCIGWRGAGDLSVTDSCHSLTDVSRVHMHIKHCTHDPLCTPSRPDSHYPVHFNCWLTRPHSIPTGGSKGHMNKQDYLCTSDFCQLNT